MTTFYISGPMDEYPQHNYPAFLDFSPRLKPGGILPSQTGAGLAPQGVVPVLPSLQKLTLPARQL